MHLWSLRAAVVACLVLCAGDRLLVTARPSTLQGSPSDHPNRMAEPELKTENTYVASPHTIADGFINKAADIRLPDDVAVGNASMEDYQDKDAAVGLPGNETLTTTFAFVHKDEIESTPNEVVHYTNGTMIKNNKTSNLTTYGLSNGSSNTENTVEYPQSYMKENKVDIGKLSKEDKIRLILEMSARGETIFEQRDPWHSRIRIPFPPILDKIEYPPRDMAADIKSTQGPCTGTCKILDRVGICRTNFRCLQEAFHSGSGPSYGVPQAEASIINGGGCPMCHRSDLSGKCRMMLTCYIGRT